jgi:hypothetical protein
MHSAVFALAFALIASRKWDALSHAQFWAEDGAVWYADAYNLGWIHAAIRPCIGFVPILSDGFPQSRSYRFAFVSVSRGSNRRFQI